MQQFPAFYFRIAGRQWQAPNSDFTPDNFARLLDGIGWAGWELVQVERLPNGNQAYYFKRPA